MLTFTILCAIMCVSVVNRPMETRLIYTKQKITFINSLCSQSKPPITILYIYHGKTSLYHRLVQQLSTIPWYFFMSIHMNDCSCVYSWIVRDVSMVRTIKKYIRTYRTSLSVYNMVHLMITLTASHVTYTTNTTDNAMCNDN